MDVDSQLRGGLGSSDGLTPLLDRQSQSPKPELQEELNAHLLHEDIERVASLEDRVRLLLGNLHNQLSPSLSSTTAESVAVSKVI